MENNVRFIRKNGRIIPIKQKPDRQKQAMAGAGFLSAAAGVDEFAKSSINKDLKNIRKSGKLAREYHYRTLSLLREGKSHKRTATAALKRDQYFAREQTLSDGLNMKVKRFNIGTSLLAGVGVSRLVTSMGLMKKERDNQILGASAGVLTYGATSKALEQMKTGQRQSVIIPKIKKALDSYARMFIKKKLKF